MSRPSAVRPEIRERILNAVLLGALAGYEGLELARYVERVFPWDRAEERWRLRVWQAERRAAVGRLRRGRETAREFVGVLPLGE